MAARFSEIFGAVFPFLFAYLSIILPFRKFNIAVVILIVRSRLAGMDRSLIEASEDLYATPFGTFRQVTLPLLMPAIVAGFERYCAIR